MASNKGGGDFKPIPEGQYAAVCDMMVDLGLQSGGNFGPKHKVYIRFQVPDERIQYEKDGQQFDLPAVTGVQQTLSLSDKSNMKPFLEAWRGKKFTAEEVREFDITAVAGKPAYINIVHETKGDKTYANIASIMPVPRGMQAPKVEGEVIIYDDDNQHNFDKLPQWLRDKVNAQLDEDEPAPSGRGGGAPGGYTRPQQSAFDTDLDDDVPFASCDPQLEYRLS